MCTSANSNCGVRTPGRGRIGIGLALTSLTLLVACAVGPDYQRPNPPEADTYTSGAQPESTVTAAGQMQSFASGDAVPGAWWELFESPALDQEVNDALTHNKSLAAAKATLSVSEDQLRAGYGVFFPQVSAQAAAQRERLSLYQFGQQGKSATFNLFTASGSVGYVLDIFGGKRRQIEALHAEADLERATALAAYLTLTSNVVNTTIARAAYRAQIASAQDIVDATTEQIALAQTQYDSGVIPYATVLGLKTQLASAQSSLAALELHAQQSEHLLAVLAGRTPGALRAVDVPLEDLTLPQHLPLSLPSELVRQRPDILVAEASLHEASAQIGVATAAMLPSLSLTGSLGSAALTLQQLGQAGGTLWSAGAGVAVPIFQGGQLWYERQASIDAYHGALADYQQVVLTAFQQVADTLRSLEHDAESVQAEEVGTAAAQTTMELARANYQAGVADYATVLTAIIQYQTARLAYVGATAQRMQDTVALYVALGGGWWNAPESNPGLQGVKPSSEGPAAAPGTDK